MGKIANSDGAQNSDGAPSSKSSIFGAILGGVAIVPN
jgi:hypothetical protein